MGDENNDNTRTISQEILEKAEEHQKSFSELLETISTIDGKMKMLWKQIYENAITDRSNAHVAFVDLYVRVHGDVGLHATHGIILTKYLERMEKANEQLLKLASLVQLAKDKQESEEIPKPRLLFERIENKDKAKRKEESEELLKILQNKELGNK